MVPAQDKTTGAIGVWNKVTSTFIACANGKMVAGPTATENPAWSPAI